jgi:hypothetical protein
LRNDLLTMRFLIRPVRRQSREFIVDATADKIHPALCRNVWGIRRRFAIPTFIFERADLAARVARAGARRRHGRATLTSALAGRVGDLIQALRVVLVVCSAIAASVTLGAISRRMGFGSCL